MYATRSQSQLRSLTQDASAEHRRVPSRQPRLDLGRIGDRSVRTRSRTEYGHRRVGRRAFAFTPADLPAEVSLPIGYTFGFAEPAELATVASIIWGAHRRTGRAATALQAVARDDGADIIVARRAGLVVGAVIVRAEPANALHLPTGVRVARGHDKIVLIRYLLHLALVWCRVTGVSTAHAPLRGATAREQAWIYRSLRGRAVDMPGKAQARRTIPA